MKIHNLLFLIILFSSCVEKKGSSSDEKNLKNIPLSHAELFRIEETETYRLISIVNPWKEGDILDKYYLVKNDTIQIPSNGKKIKIPLESIVINSATYLEFLQLLQVIDKVTGVCNVDYIYNPYILERVRKGETKDIGDSFNLDIENLLVLRPKAIMTTAYNAEDENSKKLEKTGLNILYNVEWQEKTPLGRAEWIKFIGEFFDKREMADSIFKEIENKYQMLVSKVALSSNLPLIMSGQDFRGTWSMPGGNSFNAHLFKDASANYYYSENNSHGSISTTIENVLLNFKDADVWVGAQTNTLEELGNIDSKYKLFKAYQTGNVYNYNKRTNNSQGNDYWEGAVAHPDILLADMIKVIHPELLPEHELFYIQKLK